MGTVAKNWIKGGFLLAAIPCIMIGAVGVGMVAHLLGIKKISEEK